MNYIMLASTFGDFQSICMSTNSLNDLVWPYLLIGESSIVAYLYLKGPAVHQYSVINSKSSCFFDVDCTLFVINLLKSIINLVVYCGHSVKPFFRSR